MVIIDVLPIKIISNFAHIKTKLSWYNFLILINREMFKNIGSLKLLLTLIFK